MPQSPTTTDALPDALSPLFARIAAALERLDQPTQPSREDPGVDAPALVGDIDAAIARIDELLALVDPAGASARG